MRKVFIIMIVLAFWVLSVSVALVAQQAGVNADANAGAEGEIKALELKFAELIVHGDWDEYAKHLASDYLHTLENGHVENKNEALAKLRDVQRKIIFAEMQPADSAIRIYGDTAVFNAEFIFTVRDSGQVKTRHSRVTDVFVKRDGEWHLIAEQNTPIGK
jgi:ketosteroid isomerase-like protein